MALSQNEQILAEKLKGKIVFSESNNYIGDLEKIIDINESGMIQLTNNGRLYIIPRKEIFYPNQYQKTVLDDIIKNFVPSGRFFKIKYMEDTYIQLFTNNKNSFVLNINNGKLKFIENSFIDKKLPDNYVENLKISEEVIEKIEKYQASIDNTFEDFKSSLFSINKNDLFKLASNEYAKIKAKLDYKNNENKNYFIFNEEMEYPVIESYYSTLKKEMNKNEIEQEANLFENIYNQEIEKARIFTKRNQELSDNIRQKQTKILKENRKDIPYFKKLQGKTLFFNDESGFFDKSIVKLLHVDENGYVYTNDSLFSVKTFTDDYYKYFFAYEDEFSQKDFIGKVYKNNITKDEYVNLYKNDKISVLFSVNTGNLRILDNKQLAEHYKEIPISEKTQDIISKFSNFDKFIDYVDNLADKISNKNVIEEILLNKLVDKAMEAQGLGIFINTKSDFQIELESEIFNNFSDEFLKNNFTKKEIAQFFETVSSKFESRRNQYLQQEKLDEKRIIQSRESEIEKAVNNALANKKDEKVYVNNENKNPELNNIINQKVSDRQPIEQSDTMLDTIMKLGEKNIGAIKVLNKMLLAGCDDKMSKEEKATKLFENYLTLLAVDDMNMRGSQIWIACKDVCGIDIDKVDFNVDSEENKKFMDLMKKITKRDETLMNKVNEIAVKCGIKHKVVKNGASFIISNKNDATALYFNDQEIQIANNEVNNKNDELIINKAANVQEKIANPSKLKVLERVKAIIGKIKNKNKDKIKFTDQQENNADNEKE